MNKRDGDSPASFQRYCQAAIVFATAILLATSCRSHKENISKGSDYRIEQERTDVTEKSAGHSLLTVIETEPEWTDVTLSGNMTISAESAMSSAVLIKMIRNKSISISLRPILGIEVGKIYICGDSLTAVDKYHKAFFKSSISRFFGKAFDISSLQNLLLSRPFMLGSGQITEETSGLFNTTECDSLGTWNISLKNQKPPFSYNFDMSGNNIKRFNIAVSSGSNLYSYSMVFNGYTPTEKGIIATHIEAGIPLAGKQISFILSYGKSIKWDTGTTDSIRISHGMKELGIEQIIQLISQPQQR